MYLPDFVCRAAGRALPHGTPATREGEPFIDTTDGQSELRTTVPPSRLPGPFHCRPSNWCWERSFRKLVWRHPPPPLRAHNKQAILRRCEMAPLADLDLKWGGTFIDTGKHQRMVIPQDSAFITHSDELVNPHPPQCVQER